MTTGILGYNRSNDRYGLLVMDLWHIEGIHYGETLEIWDSDSEQWISTVSQESIQGLEQRYSDIQDLLSKLITEIQNRKDRTRYKI